MCAFVVWAVNAAASTPAFARFTEDVIGLSPQATGLRIASDLVRPSAVAFTLTRNQCDCRALIGAGDDGPAHREITAAAWLRWLHDLPDHVPHLTRLAALRAWSPSGSTVVPARLREASIRDIDEMLLRSVEDDSLLVIDYR